MSFLTVLVIWLKNFFSFFFFQICWKEFQIFSFHSSLSQPENKFPLLNVFKQKSTLTRLWDEINLWGEGKKEVGGGGIKGGEGKRRWMRRWKGKGEEEEGGKGKGSGCRVILLDKGGGVERRVRSYTGIKIKLNI